MNRPQRSRWAYAWMWAAVSLAGCGESSPVVMGVQCFPACRAGTVCAPSGTCVSACNPACGAAETCVGSGATARCERGDGDGGAATDLGAGDAQATDTGGVSDAGTADAGPTPDAPSWTDLGAPVDGAFGDVVAPPTDGGPSADAFTPPTNCGLAGQPCCVGRACYGGGYCVGSTCAAPTARDPGECTRPDDCPAGQACGGLFTCGGGADGGVTDAGAVLTRGCFLCGTPPGASAFGAACTNNSTCATGLCSGGRCTVACAVGAAGDATCAARGASYRCLNLFFSAVSMGPITTLGVCAPTCARESDCAADSACVPRLNYFADRMDFACVAPSATLTGRPGDACNPSGVTTCRNILCVGLTASTGYCTAPCSADADCPASAPVCDAISFSRPGGGGQPGRACRPR